MGKSPSQSTSDQVILLNRLTTPLGPMFVAATEKGICLLEFTDRRMLETSFRDLQKSLNAEILIGDNQHIRQVKQEIAEYFRGDRTSFEVPLHTPGTEFQKVVWKSLQDLPYGSTTTYQAQARTIQNPKAVRAVASANGHNRIAIIIPCHRVIREDGHLAGYGGGLERKKWLIDFEKKNVGG